MGYNLLDCAGVVSFQGRRRGMLFGLIFCRHCFINIYNANKGDEERKEKKEEKKKLTWLVDYSMRHVQSLH